MQVGKMCDHGNNFLMLYCLASGVLIYLQANSLSTSTIAPKHG